MKKQTFFMFLFLWAPLCGAMDDRASVDTSRSPSLAKGRNTFRKIKRNSSEKFKNLLRTFSGGRSPRENPPLEIGRPLSPESPLSLDEMSKAATFLQVPLLSPRSPRGCKQLVEIALPGEHTLILSMRKKSRIETTIQTLKQSEGGATTLTQVLGEHVYVVMSSVPVEMVVDEKKGENEMLHITAEIDEMPYMLFYNTGSKKFVVPNDKKVYWSMEEIISLTPSFDDKIFLGEPIAR